MTCRFSTLPTMKLPGWISEAAKALHKTADELLTKVKTSLAAWTAADAYLTRLEDEVTAINKAIYAAVDDKRAEIAERLRTIGFEDVTPFKAAIESHPEVVRAVEATLTDCVILGGDDKRENRAAIADLQSGLGRIRQEALAAV